MKKYRFWIVFLICTLSFYLVSLLSGSDWQSLITVITSVVLGFVLAGIFHYFYVLRE